MTTTRRSRGPAARAAATMIVAAATVAACGGATTATRPSATTASPAAPAATKPCGAALNPPTRYDHVIWVWMENHTASDVLGSGEAPQTTALARACGRAARYASVGRPSLPNYLGATSGDTHGIQDDGAPADHRLAGDNLFRQVRATGRTARSYEESMRTTCQLDSNSDYAVKHNPAAYYVGNGDRTACQRDNVPLGAPTVGTFRHDLDAGALPTFSFITPNLCNDTHDCPVATGDRWLPPWLTLILHSPTYQAGRTVIFVVWDEPTPMPFIVMSPATRRGSVAATPADHYALLRTTEELLGLPLLGRAATAPSLRADFEL